MFFENFFLRNGWKEVVTFAANEITVVSFSSACDVVTINIGTTRMTMTRENVC
jgi:hypothetical protein